MNIFEYMLAAGDSETPEKDQTQIIIRKILLILELVTITFLSSFLPDLLSIGAVPTLEQLYKPVISAFIVALYAYARIRKIPLEEE